MPGCRAAAARAAMRRRSGCRFRMKSGTTMKTRILVADDHEMVRAGICSVLQRQGDNDVVGQASNGREAVDLSRTLAPDIVVLDGTMPLLNGIEAARQIISDPPQTKAIM